MLLAYYYYYKLLLYFNETPGDHFMCLGPLICFSRWRMAISTRAMAIYPELVSLDAFHVDQWTMHGHIITDSSQETCFHYHLRGPHVMPRYLKDRWWLPASKTRDCSLKIKTFNIGDRGVYHRVSACICLLIGDVGVYQRVSHDRRGLKFFVHDMHVHVNMHT